MAGKIRNRRSAIERAIRNINRAVRTLDTMAAYGIPDAAAARDAITAIRDRMIATAPAAVVANVAAMDAADDVAGDDDDDTTETAPAAAPATAGRRGRR